MTSGQEPRPHSRPRPFRRPARTVALAALLCASAAAAAAGHFDLQSLLARVADNGVVQARYREVRHSPLLSEPVTLTGRILIDPAGRFVKTSEGENPSTLRLDGDTVVLERGGETHTASVDRYPMMEMLVKGLFALSRGDADTLTQYFQAEVTGGPDAWQLTLKPRHRVNPDNPTAGETTGLVSLTIHGSGGRFRRMVLEQSAGQRTVMTFQETDAQ